MALGVAQRIQRTTWLPFEGPAARVRPRARNLFTEAHARIFWGIQNPKLARRFAAQHSACFAQ